MNHFNFFIQKLYTLYSPSPKNRRLWKPVPVS